MIDATVIRGLKYDGWQNCTFEPFRDGIEVSWLVTGEPAVAILRYQPGASMQLHEHTGLETILVLEGSQADERGTYYAGDLAINPEGTRHSVH